MLSNGMVSDGGLSTKIGAAKDVKLKVLGVRLSAKFEKLPLVSMTPCAKHSFSLRTEQYRTPLQLW